MSDGAPRIPSLHNGLEVANTLSSAERSKSKSFTHPDHRRESSCRILVMGKSAGIRWFCIRTAVDLPPHASSTEATVVAREKRFRTASEVAYGLRFG